MPATEAGKPGIAYLVNQYPKTSHSFIRREIEALEQNGVRVARYSIRPPDGDLVDAADNREMAVTTSLLAAGWLQLASAMLAAAVRTPRCWMAALREAVSLGWRSERGVLRHLAYLAEACVLDRQLRAKSIRHVHAHFASNPTAVALIWHVLSGGSYSFTAHGASDFDRLPTINIERKIERAAFVVAVSEYGRSQFYRYCNPVHWPKIEIVRCGVDAPYLQENPTPVPNENVLVCVGRLIPTKGQVFLMEAVRRLLQQGSDVKVRLIGDGEQRATIEDYIRKHRLEESVELVGWMSNEQVREAIRASRALVLPSLMEGLPVAIMEALALGRPVVSTRVAGIPELVVDGENGWLATPGSASALAKAIQSALATPADGLTRMGLAGRQRVLKSHDTEREAKKLARLFGAALDANANAKVDKAVTYA